MLLLIFPHNAGNFVYLTNYMLIFHFSLLTFMRYGINFTNDSELEDNIFSVLSPFSYR